MIASLCHFLSRLGLRRAPESAGAIISTWARSCSPLLALALLGGCALPNDAQTNHWDLGSLIGDPPGVIRIMRGAGTDEVVGLLGPPVDKRTIKDRPGEVEWIFERNVHFSAVLQSEQNVRGTGSSAYQRGRYVETARVRFKNGQVSGISIRRIPVGDAGGGALLGLP